MLVDVLLRHKKNININKKKPKAFSKWLVKRHEGMMASKRVFHKLVSDITMTPLIFIWSLCKNIVKELDFYPKYTFSKSCPSSLFLQSNWWVLAQIKSLNRYLNLTGYKSLRTRSIFYLEDEKKKQSLNARHSDLWWFLFFFNVHDTQKRQLSFKVPPPLAAEAHLLQVSRISLYSHSAG